MSIINRNNYEEYFLLYTDDELNATEKKQVEEFIQQHPDLKVELEMLQRSVLKAEPIVFHSKDTLLKNSSSTINENNYEEYFVLYVDDELTNEQKDSVEQFVYRNPKHQLEFELLQQVKLHADKQIVFPDKAILYRTEEVDEKVFVIRWWKIAAAAIVFIFLSGLGWYIVSKENISPAVVSNTPVKTIDPAVPEKTQPNQENIAEATPAIPEVISADTKDPAVIKVKQAAVPFKHEKSSQELTGIENNKKETVGRNIQLATTVINEKAEVNIQKIDPSNTMALQSTVAIIDEPVGPEEPNPYLYTASSDEIEILNTSVSKKNKLRGLFRKVSRVVEKTTSIETGDGKGLRIASFEISLK